MVKRAQAREILWWVTTGKFVKKCLDPNKWYQSLVTWSMGGLAPDQPVDGGLAPGQPVGGGLAPDQLI